MNEDHVTHKRGRI